MTLPPPPVFGMLCGDGAGGSWVDGFGEFGVALHPVAVAPSVDDVAAVEQPVQQRGGHDLVVQDLAPLLEVLVRGDHGRSVLVAAVDELEEEDGAALGDREVADLVYDQERGVGEGLESVVEPAGGLNLFEGIDEVGQSTVVDPAAALGGGDGQTDRQVGLADAGRTGDVVLTNPLLSSATPGIRYAVMSWKSAAAMSGAASFVVVLPDGTRTAVPEWMTQVGAGGETELVSSPRVSVSALGALRRLSFPRTRGDVPGPKGVGQSTFVLPLSTAARAHRSRYE